MKILKHLNIKFYFYYIITWSRGYHNMVKRYNFKNKKKNQIKIKKT